MFYFIKFFYTTVLLPPGIFILFFSILTILLYRHHRSYGRALAMITFLFYLSTTALVSGGLVHSLEQQYIPQSEPQGDVIVMLGGGATFDTPNFTTTGHLSGSAANRLLTAAELYYKLHVPIAVSGGRVFETTGREAEIAQEILIRLGVPKEKILLEDQSVNTTENAVFTKALLAREGLSQPILVTSAFHMPRAVKQFEKVGLKVNPFPTDYLANKETHFDFRHLWPDADSLSNLSLAVKEYIGLFVIRWY